MPRSAFCSLDADRSDLDVMVTTRINRPIAERSSATRGTTSRAEGAVLEHPRRTRPWLAAAIGGALILCALPAAGRPARLTLAAVGDIMFGRYVGGELRPHGYQRPFRHVRRLWARCDLVIGNLETPIALDRYRFRLRGQLAFRAEPRVVTLLREAGFTLLSTANNHAHDQGDRGVLETIAHLRRGGLPFVGTGRTLDEAFAAQIVAAGGVRVAVLAAAELRNVPPTSASGRSALLEGTPRDERLLRQVRAARPAADFVVAVLHLGAEYRHLPAPAELALFERLAAAGVDLVVAHHPHVLRGVQRLGRMLVFHSLGNLLFDSAHHLTAESGVARVTLERDGAARRIVAAELAAVRIGDDGLPRPATGDDGAQIVARVARYSAPFARTTTLRATGPLLRVVLP
jgi:poly-gamma-glutamate capsule biosynthesis protein CapA/YwtB (metallophosphatase superfamily)